MASWAVCDSCSKGAPHHAVCCAGCERRAMWWRDKRAVQGINVRCADYVAAFCCYCSVLLRACCVLRAACRVLHVLGFTVVGWHAVPSMFRVRCGRFWGATCFRAVCAGAVCGCSVCGMIVPCGGRRGGELQGGGRRVASGERHVCTFHSIDHIPCVIGFAISNIGVASGTVVVTMWLFETSCTLS